MTCRNCGKWLSAIRAGESYGFPSTPAKLSSIFAQRFGELGDQLVVVDHDAFGTDEPARSSRFRR